MPDSKIAIITDSSNDIPDELLTAYDIHVVPLYVIWDGVQYRDRVDIQPMDYYNRVTAGGTQPTTLQVSVQDFVKSLTEVKLRGATEVLLVTISSALSGTYQSAVEAIKQVDIPVHLVDSLGVTMSQGLQVLAAARVRELGGTLQAMVAKIEEVRKSMVLHVAMDTVEYVRRGGRLGDAVRLIGMVLNIKPVVLVNHTTGRVEEIGITRSYQKSIELMYQKFLHKIDITKRVHIAITHGNAMAEVEKLIERIRVDINPVEILTNITTPVLGNHTGPGAIALAGYTED